ncbi:MAG: beta-galactosidase small subunit [Lachnospiraceae bacterium]|nr:beta-galactosidase small subunit [Lachnospiraceae bacterium]
MDCINKTVEDKSLMEEEMLRVVYGDVTLGLHGGTGDKEFHYIFSYASGGMESLVTGGKEWLYRAPKPTFWRAVTDNDRGSRFPIKSGMWLSADTFISCLQTVVAVDGKEIPFPIAPENNRYTDHEKAQKVKITYTYETITCPSTQITVSYEVEGNGVIRVEVHYYGRKGLPQLPVLGLRFLMPTCGDKYIYEGLSGETYPDRKAGGIPGVYEIEGLPVTPYLVPQDCGMHMDTKWVEVYRSSVLDNRNRKEELTALRFEAEEEGFAFSCLPYTALELESATHQEELPAARRTVLCIYGAVRGVGGIDSWGADVEPAYQIDAEQDISYSFRITGNIS